MTSIFEGQPPQNKALSNQNKGHQRVPGSYRGEITNYHAITISFLVHHVILSASTSSVLAIYLLSTEALT